MSRHKNAYVRKRPWKYQIIKPLKVVFYGSSHLSYTGELFPTEIRGNALSIRALFGSIARQVRAHNGPRWLKNLYFSTEKIGLFICRDLKVNHHVQSVLKNIILEDKYLTNQKTRHMNTNVKYQLCIQKKNIFLDIGTISVIFTAFSVSQSCN